MGRKTTTSLETSAWEANREVDPGLSNFLFVEDRERSTSFPGSLLFPPLSRSRGREEERPWERCCARDKRFTKTVRTPVPSSKSGAISSHRT